MSITTPPPGTTVSVRRRAQGPTGEYLTHPNGKPAYWHDPYDVAALEVDHGELVAYTTAGLRILIGRGASLHIPTWVTPPAGARLPEVWLDGEGQLVVNWLPVIAIDLESGDALAHDEDGVDVRLPTFVVLASSEGDEARAVLAAVRSLKTRHTEDPSHAAISAAERALEERSAAAWRPYLTRDELDPHQLEQSSST